MAYNPKDHYFKKAKKENFVARSVYKLEEIDSRFKIFRSGDHVLDLGASPGSWSQYLSSKVGAKGKVLGIDLTPISLKLPSVVFIQGDILQVNIDEILKEHEMRSPLDAVVSDMAPKTTGIRMTDQARSFELCEMALNIAIRHLKPHGVFVCKLFHSDDFSSLKKQILGNFRRFEAVKPDSTRKSSKEIFLLGLDKK